MKQELYTDFEKKFTTTDYLFHEELDGNWAAIPRELINEYWNNYKHPKIIRSNTFKNVQEIVFKLSKDPNFLDKIQDV